MNKKKIIILLIILILIGSIPFILKIIEQIRIKNAIVNITYKENLDLEFNTEVKLSDLIEDINGDLVADFKIDTIKLGKREIRYDYINEQNIKVPQSFEINVIDTVAPMVWMGNSQSIYVGNAFEYGNIMCGDNYDSRPKCFVEGEYDINTVGSYKLNFKAVDNSGNETIKEFTLHVLPKPTKSGTPQIVNTTRTNFSDVIYNYKKDNNKIGIDVSGFQGDIDFEKIKEAGVEFIIIKVGGNKVDISEGNYVDSKFLYNIEQANKYNIPVGLYFYSYGESSEQTINDAKWLLEQIKGYKIDLPIAFDWENWQYFNYYHISFYELNKMATDFLDTVEKAGYKGMLYSSASYLSRGIWYKNKYPTWLAHYTSQTNYEGEYKFWQLCDNGLIDGINAAVDIDIMYAD